VKYSLTIIFSIYNFKLTRGDQMNQDKKEIHYQLKDKSLEWFIATDTYHLLRDEETYLGYQLKRAWYYLKLKLTRGI
tara:strand:+ start:807 stop:1037 length:231 start_codon:yes stop_codon:yes gene_type:complete